jgi:dTDP-4-dehydrorhamnose reductase
MRLLITGASGLLGMNLALGASKEHVVVGQINSRPVTTDLFTVVTADLLAPDSVDCLLDAAQPDVVVNCAALADIDACERNPERARALNTEMPARLAGRAAAAGVAFLHVSTDAVFDGQKGGYVEDDWPNPLSVYARTKLEGERGVAEAHGAAIIARVNLFGWSPSGSRSLAEFFYNNLKAARPVTGFADVWFCPLLVTDLGPLFLRMLEARLTGVYHVVSPECISKYEFGVRVARLFGFDKGLISPGYHETGGLSARRSPKLTLRTDKLAQALEGPLPSVSSGLTRFHVQHESGYPGVLRSMVDGEAPNG